MIKKRKQFKITEETAVFKNWQMHYMNTFHINLNHKIVSHNQLNWIQAWLSDTSKKGQHFKKT